MKLLILTTCTVIAFISNCASYKQSYYIIDKKPSKEFIYVIKEDVYYGKN